MQAITKSAKPPTNEQPEVIPRKQAEMPQSFYDRLTKREDIRRLLATLARL